MVPGPVSAVTHATFTTSSTVAPRDATLGARIRALWQRSFRLTPPTVPRGVSRFRGYETIDALEYKSTTNDDTTCRWCPVNCRRTFIDVVLPGAPGRDRRQHPIARTGMGVGVRKGAPRPDIDLAAPHLTFGRDAALAETVFHDRSVSRLHARVVVQDGRVTIVDQGSTSGTWVNYAPVPGEAGCERHGNDPGCCFHFFSSWEHEPSWTTFCCICNTRLSGRSEWFAGSRGIQSSPWRISSCAFSSGSGCCWIPGAARH